MNMLGHFHCKCKDSHIVFCEKHLYGAPQISQMEKKKKCNCPFIDARGICDFCIQVEYLLNFRTYKFCLRPIPLSLQEHLETTHQYFKRMPGCQLFFVFNKHKNKIDIYLDNPAEPKILSKTDYRFLALVKYNGILCK